MPVGEHPLSVCRRLYGFDLCRIATVRAGPGLQQGQHFGFALLQLLPELLGQHPRRTHPKLALRARGKNDTQLTTPA